MLEPLSTFGLGSVPFVKEKNSCRDIFEHWDIPFWPQYPARSLRENFLYQFLSSLPGLVVAEANAHFDDAAYRREREAYRKKLNAAFSENDFSSFEPPEDWALGYWEMRRFLEEGALTAKPMVKIQVTGPGTLWNFFFRDRVSKNVEADLHEVVALTLTAAGLAQIHRVVSHGKAPLIFIDEPAPSEDYNFLTRMTSFFKESGAMVGVHVCSYPDWDGFRPLGLDVFHFDLTAHSPLRDRHRAFLGEWFNRGSWVAWGVVPTDRRYDDLKDDYVQELLAGVGAVTSSTLSREEILNHSLIAPACGTGRLTPELDHKVFEGLRMTALTLRSYGLRRS